MADEKLIAYLKENKDKYPKEVLTDTLIKAGYSQVSIDEAYPSFYQGSSLVRFGIGLFWFLAGTAFVVVTFVVEIAIIDLVDSYFYRAGVSEFLVYIISSIATWLIDLLIAIFVFKQWRKWVYRGALAALIVSAAIVAFILFLISGVNWL